MFDEFRTCLKFFVQRKRNGSEISTITKIPSVWAAVTFSNFKASCIGSQVYRYTEISFAIFGSAFKQEEKWNS